jgi:DNA-binding MarR family transcriptional regulator
LTIYLIRTIFIREVDAAFPISSRHVKKSTQDTPRRAWRFQTVETPEREIYLLLQHVSGELIHELAKLLKPSGITPEQYHVLRILQDSGTDGTPLSAVAERSPVGDPDVTGLLDRLERRGLACRAREGPDRRVVTARISKEGRQLLDRLEAPVATLHARQLGPLGGRGLRSLRKLLRDAAAVGPVI